MRKTVGLVALIVAAYSATFVARWRAGGDAKQCAAQQASRACEWAPNAAPGDLAKVALRTLVVTGVQRAYAVGEPVALRFLCEQDPSGPTRYLLERPQMLRMRLRVVHLGTGAAWDLAAPWPWQRVALVAPPADYSTEWVAVLMRSYEPGADHPWLANGTGTPFQTVGAYTISAVAENHWRYGAGRVVTSAPVTIEVAAAGTQQRRLWQQLGDLSTLYTALEHTKGPPTPATRFQRAAAANEGCAASLWPQYAAAVAARGYASADKGNELVEFAAAYEAQEQLARKRAPDWLLYELAWQRLDLFDCQAWLALNRPPLDYRYYTGHAAEYLALGERFAGDYPQSEHCGALRDRMYAYRLVTRPEVFRATHPQAQDTVPGGK